MKRMKRMKKVILCAAIVLCGISVAGQTGKQNLQPRDTIYKIGGDIFPVDVTKVTTKYISFKLPDEPEVYTIERKQVQKIIYKNGRIEEYNEPAVTMIDDYQWEAVWLTEKKEDVAEMYKRGKISASSAPSSRSPRAAKKSATIRLQKRAANMKGIVVLVTHRETTGGYGEYPGYFIEGIVYGFEPLEDEMEGIEEEPLKSGVVL